MQIRAGDFTVFKERSLAEEEERRNDSRRRQRVSYSHRLVAPNGVEERRVVPIADVRQDEGQEAAVAVQLGVHEILKVKQVCDDVHGCERMKGVYSD